MKIEKIRFDRNCDHGPMRKRGRNVTVTFKLTLARVVF